MSTISKIAEKLKDFAYRKAFVASQINIGIPFQIRALMKARGWTQETLAEKTGMLQPRISGLMKPGKTRPNIETLRRVAEAFDCAIIVRFAPFSELLRWSEEFDPEEFSVLSFAEDFASEQSGEDYAITDTQVRVFDSATFTYQQPTTSKVVTIDSSRIVFTNAINTPRMPPASQKDQTVFAARGAEARNTHAR